MFMIKSLCLIILYLISNSYQSCKEGQNFCVLCELATDLCKQCESDLFIPDKKGGCEGSKKCKKNDNYCIECSNSSYVCQTCEEGFFPDDNGGCSKVDHCEISENGICRKCAENFTLAYKGNFYPQCLNIITEEELLNCQEYDSYGHCLKCKDNYYMNSGDRKCSNTKNCLYSSKGLCYNCDYDYYLDKSNKTNYLCLSNNENNPFWKCTSSENGITCDGCLFPYYLESNTKICVRSPYCIKGNMGFGTCSQCLENLFLSADNFSCTISDVCLSGYGHNDKCKICQDGYYNNLTDGNCYSNQKDNELKYCLIFYEKCESCIDGYYLGLDNKCSGTKYCKESYLGNCTKCLDNYHLDIDKRCTNIEHCTKTNIYYQCEECADHFFLYKGACYKDDIDGDKYKNCKFAFSDSHCSECKNGYYINETNFLCYENKDTKKDFYKCSHVIKNSEGKYVCRSCESPYYLTQKDLKCVTVPGCAESFDPHECKECIEGMCNNLKNQTCRPNSYLEEEEDEVCYRCIKTTGTGKICQKCEEGYTLYSGHCIDDTLCEKKGSSICDECKQNVEKEGSLNSYCSNYQYGCMESIQGCLKCDDFYNPFNCTKCFKGYYLDEDFYFCNECKEGCDSCTNSDNCGGCKEEEGYYTIKEASGEDKYDADCGSCINGCKTCTNDEDCEICFSGYYLNNKNPENRMICSPCGTFCEECFDESYCLKCKEGYHLIYSEDKVICEYKRDN